MKKLLLLIFTIVLFESVQAQIPQTLNYQGIARNANGEPIRYQEISVKISIIDSALAGKVAYQETRRVITNYVGLFNIVIGSPDAFYVLGNISGVDWATGNKHIKLEIDPAGQSNFTIAGITKLQSVPYALYSTPSGNASGDLTGNYPAPSIASKAVTNSKLADGSVTDIKVTMGINPAKVGLEKVNNTADIDKPISAATQVSLNTKLNIVDTSTMLSNRFNRDTVSLSNRINLKANTAEVNAALALKANTTDVNTALALKANTSDVNAALALKENLTNKSIDISADGASDSKYPSVKSVKTYVDQIAGSILTGQVNADWNAVSGVAQILNKPILFSGAYSDLAGKPTLFSGSYADLTNKPIIPAAQVSADWNAVSGVAQILNKPILFSGAYSDLAGKPTLFSGAYTDLTGTIPTWNQNTTGNASTATKLAAPKNINGIAFDGSTDITITAAASTFSGTVLVGNGGTGTSTITGIVKGNGANAMTAAVAGTDYLEPTGSAANLTNFPMLNQNTTGNAATAAKLATARKINGVDFDGSGDITVTSSVDAGTLTGTTLKSTVTNSSLTSVGTLTNLTVTNPITGSVSGNAATATTAGNITATANTTLTSLSNLATVGIITSGVWSGTAVAVEKGGTGLTSAGTNGQVLTSNGSGTLTWATLPSAGVPYSGASGALDLGSYDLTVNGLTVGRGSGGISSNTANGAQALLSNTIGSNNTANGKDALLLNTTGSNNTANGAQALLSNTTGSNNTANGIAALLFNTTGSNNTANGFAALQNNTTGYDNTANGISALQNNTTGNNNTANGRSALISNTTGTFNTANGFRSLLKNSTGGSNTASGYSAGTTNTTGNENTLIGYSADVSSNNLSNATALGNGALVAASNNIQLGNTSVTNVKTSGTITAGSVTYPSAHGTANQVLSTTGSGTLTWTTPSSGGSGVPYSGATAAVDLGSYNLTVNGRIIGNRSNTTNFMVGNFNTFLRNTSGTDNLIFGDQTGMDNTTGSFNLAMGMEGFRYNTTGSYNIGLGDYALRNNLGGSYNIAIGGKGLSINTNGTYLTAMGYGADVAVNNLTNATAIGAGAIVSASNNIQLGNTSVTNVKTSGTITADAVTYPKAHGTAGQVLSTTGSGTLTWTTPSTVGGGGSGTYTKGLNASLGGYVFFVTPDGKHGLVAAGQDQGDGSWYAGNQDKISNPSNHDVNGKNFTDWRIPSRYELNLMFLDRTNIGLRDGLAIYLSSTENDAAGQFTQSVSYGVVARNKANTGYYFRAIRSF